MFLANGMNAVGETRALNEWLDREFARPFSSTLAFSGNMISRDGFDDQELTSTNSNLRGSITLYQQYAWWDRALRAPDKLRQRMAWNLSQILLHQGMLTRALAAASLLL